MVSRGDVYLFSEKSGRFLFAAVGKGSVAGNASNVFRYRIFADVGRAPIGFGDVAMAAVLDEFLRDRTHTRKALDVARGFGDGETARLELFGQDELFGFGVRDFERSSVQIREYDGPAISGFDDDVQDAVVKILGHAWLLTGSH